MAFVVVFESEADLVSFDPEPRLEECTIFSCLQFEGLLVTFRGSYKAPRSVTKRLASHFSSVVACIDTIDDLQISSMNLLILKYFLQSPSIVCIHSFSIQAVAPIVITGATNTHEHTVS